MASRYAQGSPPTQQAINQLINQSIKQTCHGLRRGRGGHHPRTPIAPLTMHATRHTQTSWQRRCTHAMNETTSKEQSAMLLMLKLLELSISDLEARHGGKFTEADDEARQHAHSVAGM